MQFWPMASHSDLALYQQMPVLQSVMHGSSSATIERWLGTNLGRHSDSNRNRLGGTVNSFYTQLHVPRLCVIFG